MKLSTRLVLLVVGCLVPILTAQICSQINLYAKQREQLSGLALRQAKLANADMVSIIDSVHQLAFFAGQFPSVLTPGEHCEQRLTAIRQSFTQYRFLAIYAADGSLLCASDDAPEGIRAGTFGLGGRPVGDTRFGRGPIDDRPSKKKQFPAHRSANTGH